MENSATKPLSDSPSRHVLCTRCSASDVRQLRSKGGLAQTFRNGRLGMEKPEQINNEDSLQQTAARSDKQQAVPRGFLNVLLMPSKGNKGNVTRGIIGDHFKAHAVAGVPPPAPPLCRETMKDKGAVSCQPFSYVTSL